MTSRSASRAAFAMLIVFGASIGAVRVRLDPQAGELGSCIAVAIATWASATASRPGWPRRTVVAITMTIALTPSMGPDAEAGLYGPTTLWVGAVMLVLVTRRLTVRVAVRLMLEVRAGVRRGAVACRAGIVRLRSLGSAWCRRRPLQRLGDTFAALGVIGLAVVLVVAGMQMVDLAPDDPSSARRSAEGEPNRELLDDIAATHAETVLALETSVAAPVDASVILHLNAELDQVIAEQRLEERNTAIATSLHAPRRPSHEDIVFPIRADDGAPRRIVMAVSAVIALFAISRVRIGLRVLSVGVMATAGLVLVSGVGDVGHREGGSALDVWVRLGLLVLVVDLAAVAVAERRREEPGQPTGTA